MATASTSRPRRFTPPRMSLPHFHIPNVGIKRPSFSLPKRRPSISTPSSIKRIGSSMGSRMSKMMSWRYRVKNKKSSVTERVAEDEGDDNVLEGVDELPPSRRQTAFRQSGNVRVTGRHQRSSTGAEVSLTSVDSEDEEEYYEEEKDDLLDDAEKRRLSLAARRNKDRYDAFMGTYDAEARQKESRELGLSETRTLDEMEKRSLPRAASSVLDNAEKHRLERAAKWSRAHSTAAKTPIRRTRSSMSTTQAPIATEAAVRPHVYLGGRDKSTSSASSREQPRRVQASVRPTVTVSRSKPKPKMKPTGSQASPVRVVTTKPQQGHRQVVRVGKQESTKRRPSWLAAVRQGKAEKPNVREKILQREQSQVAAMESMRQRRLAAQEMLRKKREAAQRRAQRSKINAQAAKKASPKRTTVQTARQPAVTTTRQTVKAQKVQSKPAAKVKEKAPQAQEPGFLEIIQQRVYEFWDPQSAETPKETKAEPKKAPVVATKARSPIPVRQAPQKVEKVIAPVVTKRAVSPKPKPPAAVERSFTPWTVKATPKPEVHKAESKVEWKAPVFTKQEEEKEEEVKKDDRIVSWRDEQKNDLKTSSLGKDGMAAFKAMLEQNYSSQIIAGSVAGVAPIRREEPKPLNPVNSNKPKEGTPFLDRIMQSSSQTKPKPKPFKVKKVALKKLQVGAPELASYQKMRNYGLPDGAIMNKMEKDGFDPSCVDLLKAVEDAEESTPQPQPQQHHPIIMTVIPTWNPVAVARQPVSRPNVNRKKKPKSAIKGTIKNIRPKKKAGTTSRGSSNFDADVGERKAVFENLAQAHKDKMARNPFSGSHDPRATGVKRGDEGYGQGNQAVYEKGKQAMQDGVERMMVEIRSIAKRDSKGVLSTTFGELFQHYANISTNLVKYLLKARKQKLIDFEGEYLRQTRDDHVVIRVL